MQKGYYRQPSVFKDQIIFISEDDIWKVSLQGGKAERLTSNLNVLSYPHFSPDGKTIAFIGKEEGNEEVYTMPAEGGPIKRLTYVSLFRSNISGWSKDGNQIYFSGSFQEPFYKNFTLSQINKDGGLPEKLNLGHGKHISYGSRNRCVIGRNTLGVERWKRYRGGTSGVLWIDKNGKGIFTEWEGVNGNYANPMWIGERIYFISDHEGIANIYSIKPNGSDLTPHTFHNEFFCKEATTDGKTIVYSNGADIYSLHINSGESSIIPIQYYSPKVQLQRKFVDAASYLQGYDIHPKGHSLTINSRGKSFEITNWEKQVHHFPSKDGIRQRLIRYFNSGDQFLMITDEGGKEQIEIHNKKTNKINVLKNLHFGRANEIKISPNDKFVALVNHKAEIILIDLIKGKLNIIAKSAELFIPGFNWSKDSNWICFANKNANHTGNISVYSLKTKKVNIITENTFLDHSPSFSSCGNYIYFLSNRIFNPVYDTIYFDLNFPKSTKPFCVVLNKEAKNPFLPQPLTPGDEDVDESLFWDHKTKSKKIHQVKIDFEGITQRVIAMPIEEGIYEDLKVTDHFILTLSRPIKGALSNDFYSDAIPADGTLKMWDINLAKESIISSDISHFKISSNSETLIYASGKKLRVHALFPNLSLKNEMHSNRKTGWIDLSSIKISVNPAKEWEQIFNEMWRMQKEHFWVENMSKVNWNKVYKRYRPLVDRLGSRAELSVISWEMQGELGTSHAYEIGGIIKKVLNIIWAYWAVILNMILNQKDIK